MRCPRCGYISFDQVSNCLRCSKDIKKVSQELEGAVFNITAPGYLLFAQEEATRVQAESQAGVKTEQVVATLSNDDFFLDDSVEEESEELSPVDVLGEDGAKGAKLESGVELSSPVAGEKEKKSAAFDESFILELEESGLTLDKEG